MNIKNKVSKKLKFNAKYNDDSDEMTEMDSNYSDPDNDLEDFEDLGLDADYSVGDFVLVKFCGKQSVAHYAGRIDAKVTCHTVVVAAEEVAGLVAEEEAVLAEEVVVVEVDSEEVEGVVVAAVGAMIRVLQNK
uniref:Uncharacterized protein n=1 Tax=Timema shepardi TaxID=629360 RepID=A0A7R9AZ42_TIMSH|nr:unnamed protein product [Timema shepardi]